MSSQFAIFPEHIEFLANFSKNYIKKDGSISLDGNLDVGSNRIINLSLPQNNTDAATKSYVDQVVTGGTSNIEISGYLKVDSNTFLSEPSGSTLLRNSSDSNTLELQTNNGNINFSIDGGISNSLVLDTTGTLTVNTDIIFSETLGILTKTSSHEVCFMYNGGLVTDTDYALKQTNNGSTSINSKSGQSIHMNIGNTEYINVTSTKLTIKNDIDLFENTNNANPILSIGSSSAEVLQIQSVYDTDAVTLDKVVFTTKAASTTADKGKMEFNVDEVLIATIDDNALNLASGKQYEINGTNVLNSTTLGSTILSSSLTSVGTLSSLSVNGSITQTSGDILLYDSINDGNPSFNLGSGSSENVSIRAVYDTGTTDLNKITFTTKTNLTSSDKGAYEFYVDENLLCTFDDDAINLASNKQYEIDGNSVLNSTTLGPNITDSSLTSVGTLENLTVSGTCDLEGYISIGNGSAVDENSGLIIDYDKSYSALGRQLLVKGTVTAFTNTNAYGVQIAPEEIKVPGSSTSPLIASLYVDEPHINELVAGGSSATTLATTVYIADTPTEGDFNYSLYVKQGETYLGGAATVSGLLKTGSMLVDTTNGTFKIWDGLNTEFEVDNNGVVNIGTGDEGGSINIGTEGGRLITIGKGAVNNTKNIYMYSWGNSYIETDAGFEIKAKGDRVGGNGEGAFGGDNFGHGHIKLITEDDGDIYLTAGVGKTDGNIIMTAGTGGIINGIEGQKGYISMSAFQYIDIEELRFTNKTIGTYTDSDLITLADDVVTVAGTINMTNIGNNVLPTVDNTYTLGSGSYRYQEIFAVNTTINTSDISTKKNIMDSDLGLDFIKKLKPVSYNWIDNIDNKKHYGLIAQDVESILSNNEFGGYVKGNNGEYDGLRYNEFIAPLIKSIQELSHKVDVLEKKLEQAGLN